jgi:predicted acylesterase/phospholipase RssA
MQTDKKYRNLCLSGGHVKSISLLGCVQLLEELGWLQSMNQFIGSSAGSIVCLMIVLSLKSDEMKKYIEQLLAKEVLNIEVDSIFNINKTLGLDDGEGFLKVIRELMVDKNFDPNCTFMQLAKASGKNLVICGSNITKKKIEFFSVDKFPDMKVLDALRISVSIPIVLQPVFYDDCYFVDAGIFDNFPIHYFQQTQHLKDTLGIMIITREVPITGFMSYLYNIIHSLMDMTNMYIHLQATATHRDTKSYDICKIDVEEQACFSMETMQFEITKKRFDELMEAGYSSLKKFLS